MGVTGATVMATQLVKSDAQNLFMLECTVCCRIRTDVLNEKKKYIYYLNLQSNLKHLFKWSLFFVVVFFVFYISQHKLLHETGV